MATVKGRNGEDGKTTGVKETENITAFKYLNMVDDTNAVSRNRIPNT